MVDSPDQSAAPAPAAPEKPAGPALTPVHVVFPRPRNGFAWQVFWFGVLYVIAGILPWSAPGQHEVLLTDGRIMTRAEFEQGKILAESEELNTQRLAPEWKNQGYPDVAGEQIISVLPNAPQPTVGQILTLLMGLMLVMGSLVWVWHGKVLDLSTAWIAITTVFLAIWFTHGAVVYETAGLEGKYLPEGGAVRGFAALGGLFSNLMALLGSPADGQPWTDMVEALQVLGMGTWVAMFGTIFFLLALVLHVVGAKKAAGAAAESKAKPARSGSRPGSRPGNRPAFAKKDDAGAKPADEGEKGEKPEGSDPAAPPPPAA